jgi:hypothetical protein
LVFAARISPKRVITCRWLIGLPAKTDAASAGLAALSTSVATTGGGCRTAADQPDQQLVRADQRGCQPSGYDRSEPLVGEAGSHIYGERRGLDMPSSVEQVPNTVRISEGFGISRGTARSPDHRADEGRITITPGWGSFVTER